MGLPDGYDTVLGNRGDTLSGGQRQRIAIARAMIRRAPVVVLDEATTGLDPAAKAQVNESLRELARSRTTISITHDATTVAGLDRVLWLEDGRILEDGTPAELAADPDSRYSRWIVEQRSAEASAPAQPTATPEQPAAPAAPAPTPPAPSPHARRPRGARRRPRLPLLALDRRAAQRRGECPGAAHRDTGAARRDGGAVRHPVGAVPPGGPAMTTPSVRSPLALLHDHARLRGAEHLLDPARLSALLGREVELRRVRIKPGASVLVSFRAEEPAAVGTPDANAPAAANPGTAAADVGWALLVVSRDKRDNVLRRAARVGAEVREHPLPSAAAHG